MKVKTMVETAFSAAVHVPGAQGPQKRMHGHNYRLQVTVDGEPDEAALLKAVRELAVDTVEHQMLNDFIPEPTGANVAKWFWAKLQPSVAGLAEVALWQTSEVCVRVSGP